MREVSACDFCDEAAIGVFEVLPAGVDGNDPKRMVLCASCEATLSGVVDPLLDSLDGTADPVIPEAEPEAVAETEQVTESANETEADDEAADEAVHESGSRPTKDRKGTPKGYSKVMRFLEGREFPMERDEAESVVAEAYEMDPSTVEAAIDHAAKHGRVRVASGKLFR
jgi:hypothetical protein